MGWRMHVLLLFSCRLFQPTFCRSDVGGLPVLRRQAWCDLEPGLTLAELHTAFGAWLPFALTLRRVRRGRFRKACACAFLGAQMFAFEARLTTSMQIRRELACAQEGRIVFFPYLAWFKRSSALPCFGAFPYRRTSIAKLARIVHICNKIR